MTKLSQQNDALIQKIDSVRKENKIKAKEIDLAATQRQVFNVNTSKGVKGDIITILKDTIYKDTLLYNPLTKVYYTIGKDSVNIALDIENTQYLYVYKKR
jgi:signal peptidase I